MAPGCNKYASWRTFNGAPADLIFVISRDGTGVAVPTQAYSVRYSARRRYPAVVVYPDLRVEVVAPPGTPLTAIEDLYRRKSAWVARTLERFRAEPCPVMEREYAPGERFLFEGRERVLVLEEGDGYAARFDGEALRVPVPAGAATDEVRERVIELYRQAAIEAIGPMLEHHAARMGLAPPPFRVKLLRRRWGSCSRAGRLNFNLRLAMAPPDELEYIVVHELCHLVRLDHSPAYWRTVERYMPDYGARRAARSRGLLAVHALIRRAHGTGGPRADHQQWPWASSTLFIIPHHQTVQEHHGAPTISIAAGSTARTGRLERTHRLLVLLAVLVICIGVGPPPTRDGNITTPDRTDTSSRPAVACPEPVGSAGLTVTVSGSATPGTEGATIMGITGTGRRTLENADPDAHTYAASG